MSFTRKKWLRNRSMDERSSREMHEAKGQNRNVYYFKLDRPLSMCNTLFCPIFDLSGSGHPTGGDL